MSNLQLLDLTASFANVVAPTPFGTFNSDTQFQADADSMVELVYTKFGGNILQVELTNKDVYASLEDATFEYSAMVNSYHAKSVLADLIGGMTGSLSGGENKLPPSDLALAKRRAAAYSQEALVGGIKPLYSASISLVPGTQNYDLNTLLSSSGVLVTGERAEIREVFHFSPTAAYRFFDTTSAINYLHNQFGFESFTPETIFYMLPIWEDVLRAQQLELSHKVRRSNYSYNIVNNLLKIYPVPTADVRLHFTYFKISGLEDPFDATNDPMVNGISNIANVPFGNLQYSKINSMGRQWIRRFALALAKEVLGQIRNKSSEVPIPNGSLILNGPQLLGDARQDLIALREELRDLLDSTTYDKLAAQEAEQAEMLNRQMSQVPLLMSMG